MENTVNPSPGNAAQEKQARISLHKTHQLPIDGLPPILQTYINEVTRVYRCPRDFVTVAVFSAVSSVVGKRVKVFDGTYTNPLMLWFVNVACSGMNKTAPVRFVLEPLYEINQKNHDDYRSQLFNWSIDPEHKERDRPQFDQLLISDSTEEARTSVLRSSSTGVLGYYPEVKGFFEDLNRYNKGGAVDRILCLFDGQTILVNRKSDLEPMLIKDPFMNILGDLQPAVMKSTFGNELFLTNGLNQRFLFTMPEVVEFPERDKARFDLDIASHWCLGLLKLYYSDLSDMELITFTPEADQRYAEFYNKLQRKKADNLGDDYMLSVYSKLQIHAERLAGIIHMAWLMSQPTDKLTTSRQIGAAAMDYAIRCMDYFCHTARAVRDAVAVAEPAPQRKLTQAEMIQEFNKMVPIINQTLFAKSIGKQQSYVSGILNQTTKTKSYYTPDPLQM